MKLKFLTLAATLCAFPAFAQEQTGEQILQEAQGTLHLTCNTIVDAYGSDEDAMLDAIGLMIAVSLNNRGIDFTDMNLTDAEVDEIQSEFADALGDACAEDADALLAGIVDHTVADLVQFY